LAVQSIVISSGRLITAGAPSQKVIAFGMLLSLLQAADAATTTKLVVVAISPPASKQLVQLSTTLPRSLTTEFVGGMTEAVTLAVMRRIHILPSMGLVRCVYDVR
jgi:hypothetical protein